MSLESFKERINLIRNAYQEMEPGIDYMSFGRRNDGVESKPSLLKPGAEKLILACGLVAKVTPTLTELGVRPGEHLEVNTRVVLCDRSGNFEAEGYGICSTFEQKYRWVTEERKCPQCKRPVFKSKDGSGYFCWNKRGGCGATFRDNDPDMTSQSVGIIENPNVADYRNTVLKMSEKRAFVDAALKLGASFLFTQDVEDMAHASPAAPPTPKPQQSTNGQRQPPPAAEKPAPQQPAQPATNGRQPVPQTPKTSSLWPFFVQQLQAMFEAFHLPMDECQNAIRASKSLLECEDPEQFDAALNQYATSECRDFFREAHAWLCEQKDFQSWSARKQLIEQASTRIANRKYHDLRTLADSSLFTRIYADMCAALDQTKETKTYV